ncbi:cytochrome b [Salinisphaera sp. Q1T1-3]|uniref:cytochrome b n=1 Tax=Salinisphaera sp. Q1T1-3 TaxID=2321229 RepID=UPI000E7421DB|nr:cytochrome b [Salinisphaera sp. Q1T1-3]RJS93591.1 cytochrome b [Salinisphaera sp. Q1T1-3]
MPDHVNARPPYHPAAKAFHWLVAVFVFFVLPLGFLTGLVKSDVSADVYFWHESLGFTVLWLMLARLCVRFLTTVPEKPAGIPLVQAIAAGLSQWLLYLALIAQPIVGFLLTNAHGYAFDWFGVLPIASPIGKSSTWAPILGEIHGFLGWTILVLILVHISGALYHLIIRRDDTLARMT